jgi:hypothetical protein
MSLTPCLLRHHVRGWTLRESGGLGCSIEDKPKGLKVEAMWRDFGLLRELGNSGLWRIGVNKGEGTFNTEALNVKFPSSSCFK